MRKKLTALLLACLMLVGLALPASAAETPALYGAAASAGGEITLTVGLKGGSEVASGSFTIGYDTGLTLVEAKKGAAAMAVNTRTAGKVVCAWVGTAGTRSDGVLTLIFRNAACKGYSFPVTGIKLTGKDHKAQPQESFTIDLFAACDGKNCPSKSYRDVNPNAWYHGAVDYVISKGIMDGVSAVRFAPNATLTRGMVVTILGRTAGIDTAAYTGTSFRDVKGTEWFAPYVQWAGKTGLVNGYPDGSFQPNRAVTRQEMVAMLYRFWLSAGNTYAGGSAIDGFRDGASVSAFAKDAMNWAVGSGLVNGVSADTLSPRGRATRAQFAKIMMIYLETLA